MVSYTGYVLEFASQDASGAVPVYSREFKDGAFDDLLFRKDDCICRVKVTSREITDYAPLEALITALYLNHKPQTPLFDLLSDIREHIPLVPDNISRHKRRPDYKGLLKTEYEEAGFELIGFWQYGRTLMTRIGWVFPQDRQNPKSLLCLYATGFDSTPTRDRMLGKGKWIVPLDVVVSHLLTRKLKGMCPKNPVDMLNDEGKELALETFKWTKVSLLTPKELKEARIDFIRQHLDLHQNRLELAKAMIEAGLYSDTTQHSAIYKQLPGLIEAAKKEP